MKPQCIENLFSGIPSSIVYPKNFLYVMHQPIDGVIWIPDYISPTKFHPTGKSLHTGLGISKDPKSFIINNNNSHPESNYFFGEEEGSTHWFYVVLTPLVQKCSILHSIICVLCKFEQHYQMKRNGKVHFRCRTSSHCQNQIG